MTLRAGWETRYVFAYQSTLITTDDTSAVSGAPNDTGTFLTTSDSIDNVGGGNCQILLDNKPHIGSGLETIKTEKTTGLAENRTGTGYEYQLGKKLAAVSLEMGINDANIALLGWLLLQKGASEAGTVKTLIPPTTGNSECEVWGAFARCMGAVAAADDHVMTGCIPTQIAISGTEGDRVKMTVDLIGRSSGVNYNHAATDFDVGTARADHMFFNYAATLDGNAVSVASFDFTIANNAVPKFYDSQFAMSYILGRIDSTGNFVMPMSDATVGGNVQIDNFIAGTDVAFVLTATNVTFTLNTRYTGEPDIDPAEELMLNMPFECVRDSSNGSFVITADDSIIRSIP